MALIKYVRNGCVPPRGYGLAWIEWQSDRAVFLPIGIHIIAALCRTAWFAIKFPKCGRHSGVREAYWAGYNDAKRQQSWRPFE